MCASALLLTADRTLVVELTCHVNKPCLQSALRVSHANRYPELCKGVTLQSNDRGPPKWRCNIMLGFDSSASGLKKVHMVVAIAGTA